MFAEWEVFDVIKGAGELDSLLDEDRQRVLLAGVNLLDVYLIDVSVQPRFRQFGNKEFCLVIFDDLRSVVELNVRQPKLGIHSRNRSRLKEECSSFFMEVCVPFI